MKLWHDESLVDRPKSDQKGLSIHRDSKCKPRHNRVDVHIEHPNIMAVRKLRKISRKIGSHNELRTIPLSISTLRLEK